MHVLLKWAMRGAAIFLVCALAIGVWKREEIRRLWAVNSLFEPDQIVQNFSNMDKLFLSTEIDHGTRTYTPLPVADDMPVSPDVADWIIARDVTSLLILKDGQTVYEDYFLGTSADDLRIGWSISKSFLSAIFGVAVSEGAIKSLDDLVTDYVPELLGSAYENATIRNALNMATGVVFNEDYLDYNSDINKMGRILAMGGRMDEFAAELTETEDTPGEAWKYVSIDTHVVAMVLRAATGRSLPELMSENLIAPLNMSAAPYFLTDGAGVAFALGGLNMTTRDFARFGQLYAQYGNWNGVQIVPKDWVEQSTLPSAPTEVGELGYGYQWWVPVGAAPGEFMARGIYGQYIYVNRAAGVVIASTAADLAFKEEGVSDQNIAIFRQIAGALQPLEG